MLKKFYFGFLFLFTVFGWQTTHTFAEEIISDGSKIKIHYSISVEGEIIESTFAGEPIEFILGEAPIMPGFEENILGLKKGDKKSLTLEPDKGFGIRDPEAIVELPRKNLPPGDIEPGMIFGAPGPNGEPLKAVVEEVKEETVVLNFNHPLAGETVDLEFEIVDVSN